MIPHRYDAAYLSATLHLCLCDCTGGKNESETAQKEKLVIGSDIYAPYFYIDDNGDFTGIDVEIAHEACGRMNIQPVFKKIVWQNCRKAVTQSYRDCKMSASCS